MIEKFRKKPVVIEAMQFKGDNLNECIGFIERPNLARGDNNEIIITTLEGNMHCSIGDWIIKGVQGEFYPCKPDIFESTYERVD